MFSSEPLQETADVTDDAQALKKIRRLTPSFLAGTRGPRGTIWLDENGAIQETPAFPVHTVDTLGAGDAFHGALRSPSPRSRNCGGAALRLRRCRPEMHPVRRRLRCPATY